MMEVFSVGRRKIIETTHLFNFFRYCCASCCPNKGAAKQRQKVKKTKEHHGVLVDEAESEWLWHKCVKHHSLRAGSPDRKAYSQAKNIMNDRFNELPLQIGQQIRSTENHCIFILCKRLYQFSCIQVKNEHTKLQRYILPSIKARWGAWLDSLKHRCCLT